MLPSWTEVFIWDGKDLEDDSVFVSASDWHNFKFAAARDDSGAVLDFMELLGIPIIPIAVLDFLKLLGKGNLFIIPIALRFSIDISLNSPLVEVAVQPKKLIKLVTSSLKLICFDAKIESLQAKCTKEVVVFRLTQFNDCNFTYLGKFRCMFS